VGAMGKTIVLRTIDSVPDGYRLIRPAMPVAVSSNSNHYVCGKCATLLAVADAGQLHHLVIECRECGALNEVA
jgi:ribosomal protein L40E